MDYSLLANDAFIGAVFATVGGVFAAAIGIGAIGSSTMTAVSKSKSDKSKSDIRDNMMIACAMVEGVALFVLIIGYLMVNGGFKFLKLGSEAISG